jgi:hypothetical protein
MLTLRFTKRLAHRLGVRLSKDPPPSDGKLGDWFANFIEDPPVVVCVNAMSRLPLVIPALDADEVVFQFRMRLAKLLDGVGVPDHAIEAEVNSTEPIIFAPTNDRRVVGSMNDICFHVAFGLRDWGGMITETELFSLEMRLAGMPHVKQPDPFPDSVVRSVLGGVDPKAH